MYRARCCPCTSARTAPTGRNTSARCWQTVGSWPRAWGQTCGWCMWWRPITIWALPFLAGRTTTSPRRGSCGKTGRFPSGSPQRSGRPWPRRWRTTGPRWTGSPAACTGKSSARRTATLTRSCIVRRVMEYGKARFPEKDTSWQVRGPWSTSGKKYGEGGYLKLWLHSPRNQAGLDKLRQWLATGELEEVCKRYG